MAPFFTERIIFTAAAIRNQILALLLIIGMDSSAQGISEAVLKENERSYIEKLQITTDREIYAAGEKVWIRVDKFSGLTGLPDRLSKVAYLDILDLENNPVIQVKADMTGIFGTAAFLLPDTLRTGNYLIRAYTSWMQNFPEELYAYRIITVINPFERLSGMKILSADQKPDSVFFYPEGGHLVAEAESRLGIRITDSKGLPAMTAGAIVSEDGDTLCHVRTGRNGYALVTLIPPAQKRIYLAFAGPAARRFVVPEALTTNAVFTTAGTGQAWVVKLKTGNSFPASQDGYYVVISSPSMVAQRRRVLPGQLRELSFTSGDLPPGLLHLRLTDDRNNIITERWVINERKPVLKYTISPSGNDFHPRQKIHLDIKATDASGQPLKSSCSVSVTKKAGSGFQAIRQAPAQQTPDYSLISGDCSLQDFNDYLIFFRYQDRILLDPAENRMDTPSYTPEIEGHLISGSIRDRVSGDPLRNENLTLAFTGNKALCLFTRTDPNGNFNFVTRETGNREIVIQPLNTRKEYYIDLTNPFQSAYLKYDHGIFIPDTSRAVEINNLLISAQINNIYAQYLPVSETRSVNPPVYNFYGRPDKTILMSDYIALNSVKEIVAELMPGVSATKINGRMAFRIIRPYQTRPYENPPLVLVDGVPVYDIEKVLAMPSDDIERIDVLVDRYFIAGNAIDGIIHIITRKGDLRTIDIDKSVFRIEYDLPAGREAFQVPDYSLPEVRENHIPDFRNTLYWNPDLSTDGNGMASVEFYTSDEAGEYIITVTGVTEQGSTATVTSAFKVLPAR